MAFSASLVTTSEWTYQGPYDKANPLVFRKVVTNIGNAYDPETGKTHLVRSRDGVFEHEGSLGLSPVMITEVLLSQLRIYLVVFSHLVF